MILRILRGRAGQDDLEPLLEAVREDVDEWAGPGGGPVAFHPAWRPRDDGLDFVLVSTWPDAEAVLAKGGEITLPRGRLATTGRLRDAHAQHYELMLDMEYQADRPGEIVRLSSMALVQRRSSAFYDHVRGLRDELVGETGLVALHVGRRVGTDVEHAVVTSVWETAAALEGTASGSFVGGDEMRPFYASEPSIEDFMGLRLEPRDARRG